MEIKTYLIFDDKVKPIKSTKQLMPDYAYHHISCAEVVWQDNKIIRVAINHCYVSAEGELIPEYDAAEVFDMAMDGIRRNTEPAIMQQLLAALRQKPC